MVLEKISNALLLIIVSSPICAWSQEAANELYEAGNWNEAAQAYKDHLGDNPEDATAWFRLALSARQAEDFQAATNALAKAEELEFSSLSISIERARHKVLADDAAGAVEDLKVLAENGFTAIGFITNDAVLGTLAGFGAFDTFMASLETQAYPCEHDEAFSDFDFWVGEWDVHGPAGTFAGNNMISREQRGCVLIENWSSASGGGGTSINYVDKVTGEWVQVWNDASGSQINIRGGLTDEGMLLVGTIHYVASGTTLPFRGLWTALPDGRVRQYFEHSSDEGETWTSWFEGFYTRKSTD